MGLDPYNYSDPLVRKIYEAQDRKESTPEVPEQADAMPQPNANGEFGSPLDGALWMAGVHNKRQFPLNGRRTTDPDQFKRPVIGFTEWEKRATTDLTQIRQWATEYPGCGFGSVADDGPILEVDSPNVRQRFGKPFGQTLTVLSSQTEAGWKSHRYYLPADVEHIAQNATKHSDFSLRKHNMYCVSPGSFHPSGTQYRVAVNVQMTALSDEEIAFLNSEREEKKRANDTRQALIPEKKRNSTLASMAGKLVDAGMSPERVKQEIIEVNQERCVPPLSQTELEKTVFYSIDTKWSKKEDAITRSVTAPGVIVDGKNLSEPETESTIPIIDDPSDDDPRFRMQGDYFDTKVFESISEHYVPYPDPGNQDLISMVAHKLVHGTNIPLAFVREPLKAAVLHVLDGTLIHPAYPDLSLRGNYFAIAEADDGKTKGLEWAIEAAEMFKGTVYFQNLFQYKSETTFIRSFTPTGTQKRDRQGNIIPSSGVPGHPSQFLYIKEGNLVKNSSDYFAGVFSMLTNLYDQTEAATESMTNGNFTATGVKTSTVMCFTRGDYVSTFGGKGNIGGGGLSRWGITNPPPIHDYDAKDWERLSYSERYEAIGELAIRIAGHRFAEGQEKTEPIVLVEEPGATEIRLQVKSMLKKAGKVGKRLMDYFIREQVGQAATAVDGRLVMTTKQAEYARKWVEAQVQCRLNCWPSDANSQIEVMEHAIRKAVTTHFVSETKLKDASHYYREGSGGWFAYSSALKNMVASGAIKPTGKSRKGTRTYCPGSCAVHPPVQV